MKATLSRRSFLAAAGGTIASQTLVNSLQAAPETPERNLVVLWLRGGASHVDLFDPKPALARWNGRELPESLRRQVPAGFGASDSCLMGSPFGFRRYGRCGMEMSELLPQIGAHADEILLIRSLQTDACNHFSATGQLETGLRALVGRESVRLKENTAAAGFAEQCRSVIKRLLEGERDVIVQATGWDHHAELEEGLPRECARIDAPVGLLLTALRQEGLLDSTIVAFVTEFGRSPLAQYVRSNGNPGRDHHALAFSGWLAGGGIAGGRVIGATDELGWSVIEQPIPVHRLGEALRRATVVTFRESFPPLPSNPV